MGRMKIEGIVAQSPKEVRALYPEKYEIFWIRPMGFNAKS